MAAGYSFPGDGDQDVKLTTDFHLEMVCRILEDIPLLPPHVTYTVDIDITFTFY